MTVVPLHPDVRYYCSGCEQHFYEHERDQHENCLKVSFCKGCDRQIQPHEDPCPVCGTPHGDGNATA